ncbi:MAG: cyanophycin synthetase, partial [Bacteroidaceae bacterium]
LSDFQGIAHRLQYVTEVEGVKFINDSKATNVNSCFYALESMKTKVILILGGTDKGNDYSELDELIKKKVRGLIFLGADNTKLHSHFDGMIPLIEDSKAMNDAVKKAYAMAKSGDTVLLSPCCASFDLFKNMADRGNQFIENVKALKA